MIANDKEIEELQRQAVKDFIEETKCILFKQYGAYGVSYDEFVKNHDICLLLDNLFRTY